MKHARLSPSNLRWAKCAGSVREEANYENTSGAAAIDGTGSHLLLELCLNEDVMPNYFTGRIIGEGHMGKVEGWLVEPEREQRVLMALNYVARRRKELTALYGETASITVESESKSDVGGMFGRKDWYGTCDITITVTRRDECLFVEVIDYKDGLVRVSLVDNSQLLSYAGGKIRPFVASGSDKVRPLDASRVTDGVRITIVQPKTNPPVRYYDYSTFEVIKKLSDLSYQASQTDREDAPLVAGDHCRWCKHKPNCSAQMTESVSVMVKEGNDVNPTGERSLFEMMEGVISDISNTTNAELVELADARAGIIALFDKVESEIGKRLESGVEVDGYAMRPSRSSRVWALPDEDMVQVLKARRLKITDIYPQKLASPAQVMKLEALSEVQKNRLEEDYIIKKEGELKLTRVRGQVKSKAADVFNDVAQPDTTVVQSNEETPCFL